jgi:hypothetical protein
MNLVLTNLFKKTLPLKINFFKNLYLLDIQTLNGTIFETHPEVKLKFQHTLEIIFHLFSSFIIRFFHFNSWPFFRIEFLNLCKFDR